MRPLMGKGLFKGYAAHRLALHTTPVDSSAVSKYVLRAGIYRSFSFPYYTKEIQRVAYGVEVNQRAAALSDEVPLQGNA